ncbi:MAG: MFS transporter [Candidatus Bathyarchaeia archaeon]
MIFKSTFLPLFLTVTYGLALASASQLYSLIFLLGIAGQMMGGYLTDRINKMILIVTLPSVMFATMLGLSTAPPTLLVIPLISLAGLAIYGFVPFLNTMATQVLPAASPGKGLGMYFTAGIGIGALSPTIAGIIIESIGFQPTYLLLSLLALLSMPLIISATKRHGRRVVPRYVNGAP